jgi:hypothetical protein
MELVTLIILLAVTTVWIWFTVLGVIAAKYDHTLDPFQKKAQMVIALVIPFFGAGLVLHLVNLHSPEAIPKSMIPRQLRSLVFGRSHPKNRHRNNNEAPAEDLVSSRRFRSPHEFESIDSGDGGGD